MFKEDIETLVSRLENLISTKDSTNQGGKGTGAGAIFPGLLQYCFLRPVLSAGKRDPLGCRVPGHSVPNHGLFIL